MQTKETFHLRTANEGGYIPGLAVGISFQIKFDGLIGMGWGTLIGIDTGKYLIIRTPPMADINTKLGLTDHTICRYIFEGRIYNFRCTLLELIKKPYNLSIISYPQKIEEINLRRHERIACHILAEIVTETQSYKGFIKDVSVGGCNFQYPLNDGDEQPQFQVNNRVVMTLDFDNGAEAKKFVTVLRSISIDSEKMVTGLQFVKSGDGVQDAKSDQDLQELILTILLNR